MSHSNSTVLITGAGQGIGRGYALAFGAEGANVIVADINVEGAEAVSSEIREGGGQAIAVHVDISDEQSVAAMVDTALAEYGRIDVLVNNAALFASLKMKPFTEIDVEEWDRIFAINTRGTFVVTKAVAKHMQAQRGGRIVNISSGVVDDGRPNYLHYLSSKAAINGMTRGLATELGEFGITVNTVSPYGIATEVPRATITDAQWDGIVSKQAIHVKGSTDSMTGAVLFLASPAAAFITGQTLHVNGGTLYH